MRGMLSHAYMTAFRRLPERLFYLCLNMDNWLGVCCASRKKYKKIAYQAIFYLANSIEPKVHSSP
jgi:hypothetical protein